MNVPSILAIAGITGAVVGVTVKKLINIHDNRMFHRALANMHNLEPEIDTTLTEAQELNEEVAEIGRNVRGVLLDLDALENAVFAVHYRLHNGVYDDDPSMMAVDFENEIAFQKIVIRH